MLTPYEWVREKAQFPIPLYWYQSKAVDEFTELGRSALYFDVGTGKTLTAIALALTKMFYAESADTTLVIVPPVLITNWCRNIAKVTDQSVVAYSGTPAARRKLDLSARFIVVGVQIFKKDYQYICDNIAHKRVFVVVDEAQMLKNTGSDNYAKVRDFAREQQICLLTGTPLSVPLDGYAMIKLVNPTIYKTMTQFASIHVKESDFYGRPKEYQHLELLNKNLMINASRVIKEDVLKDLPELTYNPIHYDMDPKHLKLYNKLVDEEMAKHPDGSMIDLTGAQALYQALQQVPCNAEHFSGGTTTSSILDLVDSVLDELGGRKLVIFSYYVMTTKRLLAHLEGRGAVALYGQTRDRQAQLDRFVQDPKCQVIILQLRAGGAGIDDLQTVCNELLLVELPITIAAHFRQAVARVHRNGQKTGVNCRIAIANGTLQARLWENMQENDSLVNTVIRGPMDIRDSLRGKCHMPRDVLNVA